MKQKLHITAIAFLLLAMSTAANAQQNLIHYWHFNNLGPTWTFSLPNIPLVKANYSVIDTNKTAIYYKTQAGTSASYATTLDNYTPSAGAVDTPIINTNSRMGQPAGYSLRVRNPSDSMQLLLYIPSTKYKNLKLKFMLESSSVTSGMKYHQYDYSTDSGATWKTTALTKLMDTTNAATYDSVVVRFTDAADTLVKNNPKLVFRIRFLTQNTTTSGNNRFDNVTVEGDTIPAIVVVTPPSAGIQTIAALQDHFTLSPNPATETLLVATDIADNKEIAIYSSIGTKLYQNRSTQNNIPISVRNLPSGTYFIVINTEKGIYRSTFLRK